MPFERVLGQARAGRILAGFLSSGRIPSALLFCGPQGVGKALMAREFAKALLCRLPTGAAGPCDACQDCRAVDKGNHPDLKAVNASYQASLREEEEARQKTLRVDTIRHLRRDMELESLLGGWKVAVLEEAQTLESEAANALLKILEEPPPKTLWILASPQKERLPRTVLSRCFPVAFAPLGETAIKELLIKNGIEPGKAFGLARLSEGSLGRALELARREAPRPLSALSAAESLPRELALARSEVEFALFALAQDLRMRFLKEGDARVVRPLREILRLRGALRANADPKTVLTLACLEAESLAR